jgi:peptidyl-prolyl cis-trans isomerase SurA
MMVCVMVAFAFGRPSPGSAVEDAIIAVVNDELITLKDLKDYVRSTYVSLVAEGMDDTQLQAVMSDMEVNGINKLIEDKLILSKANKVGLVVREEIVDERVESIKRKYGSEQQLIGALIKNGATLTDLRNKIRDQMKIKYVIDHEVKSKVYVNPQEVTDFYEQNKGQFNMKDRVNLESVFIAYDDDKGAALVKANTVSVTLPGNIHRRRPSVLWNGGSSCL